MVDLMSGRGVPLTCTMRRTNSDWITSMVTTDAESFVIGGMVQQRRGFG